ncbi:MAG TPA: hypothetical protein VFM75_07260 [Modicisalibacter sp.]|nr:hypothetical protein [Modicisalibacter sp.]
MARQGEHRDHSHHRAYIDADATTAHVVIVRRPGMDALALSVSDLLRLHNQGYTPPRRSAKPSTDREGAFHE